MYNTTLLTLKKGGFLYQIMTLCASNIIDKIVLNVKNNLDYYLVTYFYDDV